MNEYMCERGATRGLDQAKRECLDRERWRLSCRGHSLGGHSQREQSIKAIEINLARQKFGEHHVIQELEDHDENLHNTLDYLLLNSIKLSITE